MKKLEEWQLIARINSNRKIKFVCWHGDFARTRSIAHLSCVNCTHEWNATYRNLTAGKTGCPKCSGNYRHTMDDYEKKVNNTNGAVFYGWVGDFNGSKSRADIICKCGNHRIANISEIIKSGARCKKCSFIIVGERKRTKEECRISEINNSGNHEFVRWVDGYKNKESKAVIRCKKSEHEWTAKPESIKRGHGCQMCAGYFGVSEKNVINTLNSIETIKFVRWDGDYINQKTKAFFMCKTCNFEWRAAVSDIKKGSRCPSCSLTGFNPNKRGYLYVLESSCGLFCKIGISNNYNNRIRDLKNATPFGFDVYGVYENSDGRRIIELERHFHKKYESAGFSGFDGATEWLHFTDDLESEIYTILK